MPMSQRAMQPEQDAWRQQAGESGHLLRSSGTVSLMLATGGDRRIWPDPATGRNRYGTRSAPADEEVSFSSTTATNVSRQGFLAAAAELGRLVDSDSPAPVGIGRWFDGLRGDILRTLGCTDAEIVLAASGTDAELLALSIFAGLSTRPMTNVLVAPDETGSGVPRAAAGRHFSDLTALGESVEPGAPLEGLAPGRIDVRTIAIRNDEGEARHRHDIDTDLIAAVEQELKRDRDVVVHVLDASKTGLAGVTRQAARHAAALAPGRVRVVVDACQLRCSFAQLRQDLADGFLVAVTGSKFLAGPPFSGALLVPPALAGELAARLDVPAGLSAYTAAQDWPPALRERMRLAFTSDFNLGLGVRWIAALANIAGYADAGDATLLCIKERFVGLVRSRMEDLKGISLHPEDEGDHLVSHAIVPLTITGDSGSFASFEEAQAIQLLLRDLADGPVCHIGQAVRLGPRAVLRVAASAPDIAAVSAGMAAGQSMQQAFEPIEARLDIVFRKLSAVLHHRRRIA